MRHLSSPEMGGVCCPIPRISRHPDMQGVSRMIGGFGSPPGTFDLSAGSIRTAQTEVGCDLAVRREDEIPPLIRAEMPAITAIELPHLIRHAMLRFAKKRDPASRHPLVIYLIPSRAREMRAWPHGQGGEGADATETRQRGLPCASVASGGQGSPGGAGQGRDDRKGFLAESLQDHAHPRRKSMTCRSGVGLRAVEAHQPARPPARPPAWHGVRRRPLGR
jgi:hypothetical protein